MIQITLPEIPITLFGAVGQLVNNRTYYVAPTGSDSNDGSASKPFLTIQKAVDVVATSLAIAPGVTVTVQLADGTYALQDTLTLRRFIGAGSIKIVGNTTSPSSVVITNTSTSTHSTQVFAASDADYTVDGVRMESTVGAPIAFLADGGALKIGKVEFGPGFLSHIHAVDGGRIDVVADYAITGGATHHVVADRGAIVNVNGRTITISGTPTFTAFATAQKAAVLQASSLTFSGAASGQRYLAALNGVIHTGGGASYFPGSIAGSTNAGGQYA